MIFVRVAERRSKQARVLRNDERILDAATRLAAERGWSSFRLVNVGEYAGLSKRPVMDRYPNRSQLAAALWRERLDPALTQALTSVVAAGGQRGGPVDAAALNSALEAFVRPSVELRAAAEILLVSQYDAVVDAEVRAGLMAVVLHWCTPRSGELTRANAARRAYLVLIALGLLLAAGHSDAPQADLAPRISDLAMALADDRRPVALPKRRAQHVGRTTEFATDDPDRDALCEAALELVATHGVDGTTTKAVAHLAGFSEAKLFLHFDSKMDLFQQAIDMQQRRSGQDNTDFVAQVAQDHTRGIAEAVLFRELMRPSVAQSRLLASEHKRVSFHEPEVQAKEEAVLASFLASSWAEHPDASAAEARSAFHYDYATGLGCLALPILLPEASTLPYDVVTVPMIDGTAEWRPAPQPRW